MNYTFISMFIAGLWRRIGLNSPLGINSVYVNVICLFFSKFYAHGDIPLQALWFLDAFLSLSPYLIIYL